MSRVRLAFRPRFLAPAAVTLALGLFVLVYRGPLWRPLRAHGGDVLVVPFLCFLAGLFTTLGLRARLACVGAFAVGVELLQTAPWLPRGSLAMDLTLGSTFDPWDLVAYAAGLGLVALCEARVPGLTPRPSTAPAEGPRR